MTRASTPSAPGAGRGDFFEPSDEVRALVDVGNEGVYPHKAIGETLVQRGDTGIIREWAICLGEVYYTVEFDARAAVVAIRAHEMTKAS